MTLCCVFKNAVADLMPLISKTVKQKKRQIADAFDFQFSSSLTYPAG